MSTVYLMPMNGNEPDEVIQERVTTTWAAAGFDRILQTNQLAAIKLHVGEPGTETFVPPVVAASIVECVHGAGAQAFLTDTAVLYRSPRDNGLGHSRVAHQHGFTLERVGAPFLPADGLTGADAHEVRVDGRHFDTVSIASAIVHAHSLVVISHATGHLGTGFGGALKNLGMGCGSKKAKLRQHHGQQPRVAADRCQGCSMCEAWCPTGALTVDGTAALDSSTCIGCGECVAACREGAITFDWQISGARLQERIVEHAAGVLRDKPDRVAFVTMAQSITKDCDCLGIRQPPLLPDIGILASRDPVAIDRAVLDLVAERSGRTLESMSYPGHDATVQTRYAAQLGLGDDRAEVVVLEP